MPTMSSARMASPGPTAGAARSGLPAAERALLHDSVAAAGTGLPAHSAPRPRHRPPCCCRRVNRRPVCMCVVGSCTGGTAGNGWCVPVTQPPNPPTCALGQSGCATGSCSQPCPAGIDPNTGLRGSGVCVNDVCQLLCAIDGLCSNGAGVPTCACPHKNGVLQVCGLGLPTPGPSAVCA